MNRADLIHQLELYLPKAFDTLEASHVLKTIDFIRRTLKAFERDHEALGHITGSALVSSMDHQDVLLNLHGQAKIYMNFGGHCDGDEDVYATAQRELQEEAGIHNAICNGQIFDVDVHYIAPHVRQGVQVPAHLHYDILYLFNVPRDVSYASSEESDDIRWFTLPTAFALDVGRPDKDAQRHRYLSKVKALQA